MRNHNNTSDWLYILALALTAAFALYAYVLTPLLAWQQSVFSRLPR